MFVMAPIAFNWSSYVVNFEKILFFIIVHFIHIFSTAMSLMMSATLFESSAVYNILCASDYVYTLLGVPLYYQNKIFVPRHLYVYVKKKKTFYFNSLQDWKKFTSAF